MLKRYIRCSKCRQVIGVLTPPHVYGEENSYLWMIRCRGIHLTPKEIGTTICWGLLRKIVVVYPETNTKEEAYRYIGPPLLLPFIVAMLFGVKRHDHESYRMVLLGKSTLVWMPYRKKFWRQLRLLLKKISASSTSLLNARWFAPTSSSP